MGMNTVSCGRALIIQSQMALGDGQGGPGIRGSKRVRCLLESGTEGIAKWLVFGEKSEVCW